MIRFPFSFPLFVFHCYPFMILIKLIFSDAFIALCGIFIKHDRRIQEKKSLREFLKYIGGQLSEFNIFTGERKN